MTISTQTRSAGPFTGTGLLVSYPFAFKVFQTSDILVNQTDTNGNASIPTLGGGYTVVLNADQNAAPGGAVTPIVPLPTGYTWLITSAVSQTQGASLTNAGGFFPKTIEDALDRLTILLQQGLGSGLVRVPDIGISITLPSAASRAGSVLGFDASGNPIAAAPTSSGVFNFIASGFGSVVRFVQDKLRERVSIVDYGCVGDGGITNNRPLIQACINANPKKLIIVPPGDFACTDGIPISIPIAGTKFKGDGIYASKIRTTSTTNDLFQVVCDGPVEFEGVWLSAPGAGTAGRLVSLAGVVTANAYSVFRDCLFENGFDALYSISAMLLTVDNCKFSGFKNTGVTIQNTWNADAGDSTIKGCTFSNAATALACIRHVSSGGLRVKNNKINTAQFGYLMQLVGVTSDLLIKGNSFENQSNANMAFSWVSGAYDNIIISGNQCAVTPNWILMNDAHVGFFNKVSITGNTSTATGFGLLIDNASDVTFTGNTLTGNGSGGSIGFKVGANVTGGCFGPNRIRGYAINQQNLSTSGVTVKFTRPLATLWNGAAGANTTVETVSSTAYIPALEVDGTLRIKGTWQTASTGNSKVLRVRLGGLTGQVLWTSTTTVTTRTEVDIELGNAGVTNLQVVTVREERDSAIVSTVPSTTTVDTSVPTQLVFTYQKTNGADSITNFKNLVELLA